MEQPSESLSRRERERKARRAEMLAAAQEVFAEKGYNNATLEEVAARAEFGKGTLYNYFPGGKQEILLAIVEHFHDELCSLITRTFDANGSVDFRTSLTSFFEDTFAFFLERSELFLTLLQEAHRIGLSDDPEPRQFFGEQRERAIRALAIPLEEAMHRGEIRRSSPRLLAHMILVNLNGAQMKACMSRDTATDFPSSASSMAQFLTALMLDGVGHRTHDTPSRPSPGRMAVSS